MAYKVLYHALGTNRQPIGRLQPETLKLWSQLRQNDTTGYGHEQHTLKRQLGLLRVNMTENYF